MKKDIKNFLSLLKCPYTGSDLRYENDALYSAGGLKYNIVDGIADLISGQKSALQDKTDKGYKGISQKYYDKFVSNACIMKMLWGVDLGKAYSYFDRLYDYPDGLFLDIPCGTGLLSSQLYLTKPDSIFFAADHSMDMLIEAKKRCKQADIRNVVFVRADVLKLPFQTDSFDACFSLNGFHVFPHPDKAASEIASVMKKNATFVMTAACSEEKKISDFIMKHIMIPKGYINNRLPAKAYEKMIREAGLGITLTDKMGAMIYYRVIKE